MKKFFISLIMGITFIILIPVVVVGLGASKEHNVNKTDKIDMTKFSIKPTDVIFNESNGGGPKIKIYITKENKIEEMCLEEYVRGVVCGEMPAEFNVEAIKAQAVAARTYALAHMEEYGGTKCNEAKGANLCDTVHCEVFMHKEERLAQWPKSTGGEYWNKITQAVKDTEGQVLTYNDKLVMEPYFFATSSGKTESSEEIFASAQPYLKSVDSKGEESAPKYKSTVTVSYKELANKINGYYPKAKVASNKLKNQISIIDRTEGGSVKTLKIGSISISGTQFRSIIGLNSSNFNFTFNSKKIDIICKGYGHDVGMSQWGANAMAKDGKAFDEILKHYYQGVKIQKMDW